ncbi:MAG: WYL domain-containing protein [Candidatus Limnocylindrales bacterium]
MPSNDRIIERGSVKWDRAARYLRIATILHAHSEGISAQAIADQLGASKRTVYRDLRAMDEEAGLPIWQDSGKWGMDEKAFLPPLNLTLHEAMTLFLAARVLAKTTDEHDPELIAAFVKLAQIVPPVLAEHIQATVDAIAQVPRNDRFTRVFRTLTEAWANRRVVEIEYDPSAYDPSRTVRKARVRPYAIEPSALTHALYLIGWDEERGGRRTFKVERILSASMTTQTFEPDAGGPTAHELLRAWDVMSDEPAERVVVRFDPSVARRAAETRWHPSQELAEEPDGALRWTGRISGLHEIKIWILGWGADVEVLEPAELRQEIAADLRRAADRYGAVVAPAACKRTTSRSRASQ